MSARFSATLPLALLMAMPSLSTAAPSPARQRVMQALGIARPDRVLDIVTARLNRDESAQTIVITCRTWAGGHPMGGDVAVLESSRDGRLRVVWRQRKLNPWKLAIGDVDGDGQREIAVGVWKKSPKDPVMAKRSFFYTWNGRRMLPKWLGSRLSRRFDDFALGDVNGDGWDELISLEVAPRGRHRIGVYRWKSFGFEWLGGSPDLPGLAHLRNVGGRVVASGASGAHGSATVTLSHNKVVLAR